MSMAICCKCWGAVNTDDDPESAYVIEDKYVCEHCRDLDEQGEVKFANEPTNCISAY